MIEVAMIHYASGYTSEGWVELYADWDVALEEFKSELLGELVMWDDILNFNEDFKEKLGFELPNNDGTKTFEEYTKELKKAQDLYVELMVNEYHHFKSDSDVYRECWVSKEYLR